MPEGQGMDWASRGEASPRRSTSPFTAISDSLRAGGIDDESAQALSKIETDLGTLQQNMSGSWDRLNSWESKLRKDATHLDRKQLNLSAREAELDAHDAALRGQLHDLTRYHEQISAREKELAVQLAKIQNEKDSVAKAQSDLTEREVGIVRKADELTSREHVLAQRWARVQSAACPHCGKAMRSKPPGAPKP
jgi:septal ring factor EnvC (AmiA/AmiB activator)